MIAQEQINLYSWPDVRRSIFKMDEESANDLDTMCCTQFIGLNYYGNNYLGDQYKRAADIIVASKQKGVTDTYYSSPEGLFMPVAYLYRHSLELKLKGLLEQIIECDLYEDVDKVLDKHNIIKIWQKIKPILKNQWPKAYPKPLNNTEALITDFHKIDKSGQALRYPKLKNGNNVREKIPKRVTESHKIFGSGGSVRESKLIDENDLREKFPKRVSLVMLKDAFNEIYHLLDGCKAHFDAFLDYDCG